MFLNPSFFNYLQGKKMLFFASCFVLLFQNTLFGKIKLNPENVTLEIKGTTIEELSGTKIHGVKIVLLNYQTGLFIDSIRTTKDGKFIFKVDVNKEYLLIMEKNEFVKKKVLVNTIGADNQYSEFFFSFTFPMTKKGSPEYGVELLDKPVSRVAYDTRKEQFSFDQIYAANLKRELDRLSPAQKLKLIEKLEGKTGTQEPARETIAAKTPPSPDKKTDLKTTPVPAKKEEVKRTPPAPVVKKEEVKAAPLVKKEEPGTQKEKIATAPKETVISQKTPHAYAPDGKMENKTSVIAPIVNVDKTTKAKIELKRREASYKKTVVEIVERRELNSETFRQLKYLKKAEKKQAQNRNAKYSTVNPLTSFYDYIDTYEIEQKNKKIKNN